jgi:hypothetical protein
LNRGFHSGDLYFFGLMQSGTCKLTLPPQNVISAGKSDREEETMNECEAGTPRSVREWTETRVELLGLESFSFYFYL